MEGCITLCGVGAVGRGMGTLPGEFVGPGEPALTPFGPLWPSLILTR